MFNETWIAQDTLDEMTRLVHSVKHLEGDIVEFGVWEGRSALTLARAAAPETLHAVDHWLGSPTLTLAEYAPGRDVYAQFLRNVEDAGISNIQVHKMPTGDFHRTTRPVKFLHIDADHGYEGVAADIRWGLANMVPGGVICGDDYSPNWLDVVRAVDELIPQRVLFNYMWVWQVPS